MFRIAVIDDDETLMELLHEIFAEKEWEVVPCRDAHAVAHLQREPPDAILLALRLRWTTSGWDVLHDLRTRDATRTIPIIVWSGAIDELKAKEVWFGEHGIPTLSKPFTIEELFAILDAALVGRTLQQSDHD